MMPMDDIITRYSPFVAISPVTLSTWSATPKAAAFQTKLNSTQPVQRKVPAQKPSQVAATSLRLFMP
jgi:hypothetical protein